MIVARRTCASLERRRPAFTLIEVLVVVAIIALLIAVLLPSLNRARESGRASVCGHHIRQLISGGNMWMLESKAKDVPAHRGWVPHVLKALSWQTELFRCPSDEQPVPIAPVLISQHRTGFEYPTLSIDSAYFRRWPTIDPQKKAYRADMETEADVAGGDKDFNDCYVYTRPIAKGAPKGVVWAEKASTGRRLDLHDVKGKTLIADFTTTPEFEVPILWGSFAMNLSVAIPGGKPWNLVYLDYNDWSAVTETALNVYGRGGLRGDKPGAKEWAQFRHHKRANVGFLDTHVERLLEVDLVPPGNDSEASVWHPRRPAGWTPPYLQ